ncbi:hypothetical protein [Flavobacterium sp.]
MTNKIALFLIAVVLLIACQDNEKQRAVEQLKEQNKQIEVFNIINKNWNFNGQTINASSQKLVQNWTEWRAFLNEINQKPKSSIGAFQKKAKTLSRRAAELNNNIPEGYNKPEVKSRISAITTKINSLNLFINLQNIPEKKVIAIIPEINQELQSLQLQFSEIDQKSHIKMEDGEADMIRMLDTTRAIPSAKSNKTPEVNQKTASEDENSRQLRKRRKSLISIE